MSKQKYLVTRYIYFVDPHGTPDKGGKEKFITSNKVYGEIDTELYYGDSTPDPENFQEEDDLWGSEDGYNREYYMFDVKKITDEQAIEYKAIINAYNKLK